MIPPRPGDICSLCRRIVPAQGDRVPVEAPPTHPLEQWARDALREHGDSRATRRLIRAHGRSLGLSTDRIQLAMHHARRRHHDISKNSCADTKISDLEQRDP